MQLIRTKSQLLETATDLWKSWWQSAPVAYPNFLVELHYLDFFIHLLKDVAIDPEANGIPVVQSWLELAFKKSSLQIEQVLAVHQFEDAEIKKALSAGRLIVRKHWQAYNGQARIKKSHALPKALWEDYNHWLLALTLWKGFVRSFDATFTIHLPEDAYDPAEVLLKEANKPLWGMWMAFDKLGRTVISTANKHQSISVFPFISWQRYKGE